MPEWTSYLILAMAALHFVILGFIVGLLLDIRRAISEVTDLLTPYDGADQVKPDVYQQNDEPNSEEEEEND